MWRAEQLRITALKPAALIHQGHVLFTESFEFNQKCSIGSLPNSANPAAVRGGGGHVRQPK